MTMLNCANPDAPPQLALTDSEMTLLDHFVPDKTESQNRKSVKHLLSPK
jgi:hypothetical protein